MPSIIEVDTIKNKTGTQNTVLSTDGSGNVTIANSTFNGAIASSATGTFSGTIGSGATFPTKVTDKTYLYRSEVANAHSSSFGDYTVSANLHSSSCRHSISVPEGFTSIQSMYYVWLAAASSAGGYTLRLQAVSNKNGEQYNGTSLSATTLLSSAARTFDQVNKENVLSVSAINSFMTTNVEGGDLLGIRVFHDTPVNQYAIGFMITWRF